jgi:glutathione-independent formaldehyde dehydrogenase
MCADIFPTGWHATELAGMKPGDAVVIYGAGPVGLMAAHSAMIKGACSVMVVDCHSDRLKLAESIGAIAIDYSKEDPVQRVMDLTHGMGADVGCECVGYQCHDHHHHRQERPDLTMNNLVNSVKFTGGIGVVGVFVPQDPGGPDELAKQGEDRARLGHALVQGSARRHRPVPRQGLQPATARPDPRRPRQAVVHRVA